MIDSGLVPRGKGEKQPGEGGEIVPETICLRRLGAEHTILSCVLRKLTAPRAQDKIVCSVTGCLLKNEPTSLFILRTLTELSSGRDSESDSETDNSLLLQGWAV